MISDQEQPASGAPPEASAIEALESRVGARWEEIRKARARTDDILKKLKDVLADLTEPNCAVVVTGSLGRGEASADSDADWVLLVDGPSDPHHALMAQRISERIRSLGLKDVGPTGTFGNIVVSHELVHYIAGTRDTNENLTRRILLLAESRALTSSVVRQRVIRNVLARYVFHDRSVRSKVGNYNKIPHFLLNDVVRYWRTMASDYASKMWERNRKGWGTRNIKLRFSRKLLFIWGILASFSAELFACPQLEEAKNEDEFLTLLGELIRQQTEVTPLDLLARILSDDNIEEKTAKEIFSAYDEFLRALGDPETRSALESVDFEKAAKHEVYDRLRNTSRDFRLGINAVFFDQHPQLRKLIREYGVF